MKKLICFCRFSLVMHQSAQFGSAGTARQFTQDVAAVYDVTQQTESLGPEQ